MNEGRRGLVLVWVDHGGVEHSQTFDEIREFTVNDWGTLTVMGYANDAVLTIEVDQKLVRSYGLLSLRPEKE